MSADILYYKIYYIFNVICYLFGRNGTVKGAEAAVRIIWLLFSTHLWLITADNSRAEWGRSFERMMTRNDKRRFISIEKAKKKLARLRWTLFQDGGRCASRLVWLMTMEASFRWWWRPRRTRNKLTFTADDVHVPTDDDWHVSSAAALPGMWPWHAASSAVTNTSEFGHLGHHNYIYSFSGW